MDGDILWQNRAMTDGKQLIKLAMDSEASDAAILDTSGIQFHEDVRKACEANACRQYNTSWMGPPAIGLIRDLTQRVLDYRSGLLFQTVHDIESNFDFEGMMSAGAAHAKVFRTLLGKIRNEYPAEEILGLDVGCCHICGRCAYLDKEPCRNPDQAASSVEAYGMNVIALQKSAGLPYNNGKNRVTYVGLILFDKKH